MFYEWSPRDNAVCAQVEVTSTICISFTCHSQFSPSPATSRIDFMLLYKYRTQMDPQYVEFQKTQSESRISTLHLQLSKVKATSDSMQPHVLYSPWNSPGQNTGVGSRSLLQRIFPIQGLNPSLPHCRQILYQLSHQGSPWLSLTAVRSHAFQFKPEPAVNAGIRRWHSKKFSQKKRIISFLTRIPSLY